MVCHPAIKFPKCQPWLSMYSCLHRNLLLTIQSQVESRFQQIEDKVAEIDTRVESVTSKVETMTPVVEEMRKKQQKTSSERLSSQKKKSAVVPIVAAKSENTIDAPAAQSRAMTTTPSCISPLHVEARESICWYNFRRGRLVLC